MRTDLRRDLTTALRARDAVATGALRSALAAIENAEAVPLGQHPSAAAQVVGPGAADVTRRELTDADVRRIVEREIRDRSESAEQYRRLGRHDRAERLSAEADVLSRYLRPSDRDRR